LLDDAVGDVVPVNVDDICKRSITLLQHNVIATVIR
jgi:hypothetical protein